MDCIKVCTKKKSVSKVLKFLIMRHFYNLNSEKCLSYNSLINHTCQAKNFFCLALFEFS